MNQKTIIAAVAALLAGIAAFLGFNIVAEDLLPEQPPNIPDGAPPVIIRENQSTGAWYDIYFTNPLCPPAEERSGGVDELIAADMLEADVRVDIATFDLDSQPIIDALIELDGREIETRIVVDSEHTPPETVNRLRRNGVSVVEDNRSALMHNKFIVIDGRFVWTGSLNFTENGVYCNNNNLVRFDSPRLAGNYSAEMDEMVLDRLFGPGSPENTLNRLNINGVDIENYFSAEDDLAPIIARVIARADEEVLFMAFSFTNDDIGQAIFERAEAGLRVQGVFERTGADSRYSYFGDLADQNMPNLEVRKDGNGRIMHHKVFIIDRETVIFGSYNFTGNAESSNDENLVVVHDPTFAGYFVEEFEVVWAEASP